MLICKFRAFLFLEIPHNTAAHPQGDLLRGAGGAFSDICCLQISRFTASKPSKSAIASVKKFTRQLTTLIVRYFLNMHKKDPIIEKNVKRGY